MATDCKITHVIGTPVSRMAELLRTSLAEYGFRIDLINDELCELTAQLSKVEREGGTTWNYEYHIYASWTPEGEGSTVFIR